MPKSQKKSSNNAPSPLRGGVAKERGASQHLRAPLVSSSPISPVRSSSRSSSISSMSLRSPPASPSQSRSPSPSSSPSRSRSPSPCRSPVQSRSRSPSRSPAPSRSPSPARASSPARAVSPVRSIPGDAAEPLVVQDDDAVDVDAAPIDPVPEEDVMVADGPAADALADGLTGEFPYFTLLEASPTLRLPDGSLGYDKTLLPDDPMTEYFPVFFMIKIFLDDRKFFWTFDQAVALAKRLEEADGQWYHPMVGHIKPPYRFNYVIASSALTKRYEEYDNLSTIMHKIVNDAFYREHYEHVDHALATLGFMFCPRLV